MIVSALRGIRTRSSYRCFCLSPARAWALALAILSGWATSVSAGIVNVAFQAPTSGGLVAHEAIRVGSNTFSNTIDYNTKPVLAPFQAADGTGGRYTEHPDSTAVGLQWNYMALDGAGAFTFTQSGTTTFGGSTLPYGSGHFFQPGTRLPLAAHVGQLTTALQLPNGLTLGAGTTLYSDLSGFRADYDNSAHYWYDGNTNVEHRTYTGGSWGFFYEDSGSAGNYLTLAEYHDVVFDFQINYRTGAVTTSWSGNPVAVNGLILPGSVSGYGLTSPINTTGVLAGELNSPFTGFYGRFGDAFTMSFDVDNARVVPEPPSLMLLLMGGLSALILIPSRHRRRVSEFVRIQ